MPPERSPVSVLKLYFKACRCLTNRFAAAKGVDAGWERWRLGRSEDREGSRRMWKNSTVGQ